MSEYIECSELLKRLEVTPLLELGVPPHVKAGVLDLVSKQPAADVAPVRHGEWEWDIGDVYSCSVCGEKSHVKEVMEEPTWDFCPNCGAKMDGGERR